jgi:hypothetical protein
MIGPQPVINTAHEPLYALWRGIWHRCTDADLARLAAEGKKIQRDEADALSEILKRCEM